MGFCSSELESDEHASQEGLAQISGARPTTFPRMPADQTVRPSCIASGAPLATKAWHGSCRSHRVHRSRTTCGALNSRAQSSEASATACPEV